MLTCAQVEILASSVHS